MQYKLVIPDHLSFSQVENEIQRGGRFIVYSYCISILAVTLPRLSPAHFVLAKEANSHYKGRYNRKTLIFGWWAFPWGPIHTFRSLAKNNAGGIDVTADIVLNLTEETFQDRIVFLERIHTIFSKPEKSNAKAFKRALKKLSEESQIKQIVIGLFLNVEEHIAPFHVIGIAVEDDFEEGVKEMKNVLNSQFQKYIHFEFINLVGPHESEDDFPQKLIMQGERFL